MKWSKFIDKVIYRINTNICIRTHFSPTALFFNFLRLLKEQNEKVFSKKEIKEMYNIFDDLEYFDVVILIIIIK